MFFQTTFKGYLKTLASAKLKKQPAHFFKHAGCFSFCQMFI